MGIQGSGVFGHPRRALAERRIGAHHREMSFQVDIFLKSGIFLIRKPEVFRKMITEKSIIEQLKTGEIELPPLKIRFIESDPIIDGTRLFDVLVDLTWQDQQIRFAVECKAASTPKILRDALNQMKLTKLPEDIYPLLVVPYLSDSQLQELEQEKISGIDLSGNGIVIVPGRLSILRSGQKNRFPSSAPIKNIYRRNSSMVGRMFLSSTEFNSVQNLCDEINKRNPLVAQWDRTPMSLATVSKSLKTLESDLIIDRARSIRLLQPDKLLEKLTDNYPKPTITDRVQLKVTGDRTVVLENLFMQMRQAGIPVIVTGLSSVSQYTVMQRSDAVSVYCPRIASVLDRVSGNRTDRFPNLELIETPDEPVYFDPFEKAGIRWASPVQTYLELMMGDKRDRETAEQVLSYIINEKIGK